MPLRANELGVFYEKRLADGRLCQVIPLTLGRARICVGNEMFYDDSW